MRTTSTISFYCRESKKSKKGLAPLELSICINGQRKFINLPIKFAPSEFNRKKQPKEIAENVEAWRVRINGYITELLNRGMPLTTEGLREVIRTGGVKSYTIEKLFEDYLMILRNRIGTDLSEGVYRKYVLVMNSFFGYVDKNKECGAITNSIVLQYHSDLKQKYDTSTVCGYMTKLKTFVRFGMDNGHITINPFQNIKLSKGKKDIIYLTEEEIMRIKDYQYENESLENVVRCFIAMCGTGLAYADIAKLNPETDIQELNGTYYITKGRAKNGHQYTSVILPWALEALHNFKTISNQKMNCYLKVVADLVGLQKKLTCHIGRHSYATLLLNRYKVPLPTVSLTLGHTNTAITKQYYAKIFDTTIVEEVARSL